MFNEKRTALSVAVVCVCKIRDEDDEDIKAFPIVKENAAQLIEQGINTLQKTLLLKKEVEVEKVRQYLSQYMIEIVF